jgi:hypothetical protein
MAEKPTWSLKAKAMTSPTLAASRSGSFMLPMEARRVWPELLRPQAQKPENTFFHHPTLGRTSSGHRHR